MRQLYVSEPLIKHLKEHFPDRLPRKKDVGLRDIHVAQGNQQVIEYLEAMYLNQDLTEV